MKLPNSLSTWATQLKIFPDDISLAIGAMARKLAPFISPLYAREESADLDPNGYDGVARRGIYERLLLSELALADEISEEFIRRAVMGEHLFLNLARVAPSADRISIALFNAGAEQLGTPRIAQLAVLIVLARRAEAAKAEFAWGVLQDEELTTLSEVTESNVLSLINARTPENLEPEHLEKWRERLNKLETVNDVWLIGGAELKNFEEAKSFSTVEIEDVLEPNHRQLQISVRSASGAERQATLELPEDAICSRLLRNPFEIYRPTEKIAVTGRLHSFIFDDNGGKMFARGDARSVLYFSVPNSPNAPVNNPRRYRLTGENEILLAAGRLGKSVATVSLNEDGHLKLDYQKFGNFKLPVGNYSFKQSEFVLAENDETLFPIYNLHYPNSPFYQAAILDAKNRLFVLHSGNGTDKNCAGQTSLEADGVLAAARLENRFVYVGRENWTNVMQIVSCGGKRDRRDLPIPGATQAFFGRGSQFANKDFGLLAVGDAGNLFAVITQDDDVKYIQATTGSEVVGIFHDPGFSAEVGLVELEENRRTLNFNVGRKYTKQILSSDEEIDTISFSHRSPVFAYKTFSGKVVIFSLTHRVPIGVIGG